MPLFDLTATLINDYKAKSEGINKNVQRTTTTGALDLVRKQTNDSLGVVSSDVRTQFNNAFGGNLSIVVDNYQDPTITNVRTCAVQTGGTSNTTIPVTVVTLAFGFAISRDLFYKNQVSYQETFDNMLRARELKSLRILDAAARNFIDANKNTYFPADLTAYYPQVGGALRVPYDQALGLFNNLTAIMQTMDYGDQTPDLLTNPIGNAQLNPIKAQGANNATNTAYQFAGYPDAYVSNRVTNGTGVVGTYYLVNPGSTGFLTRIDPTCARGVDHGTRFWTTYQSPILGAQMGLYWRGDCADLTGTTWQSAGLDGLTRAEVESYEFSMDYAFIGPWNARPSADFAPIQKIELLAAA